MWFHSLLASWKAGRSHGRRAQLRPAHRGTRLLLEQLEDRSLPSSYAAASVSALIADITAANTAGGSNTITLTAPTTSPYVLTATNNSTRSGGNGLPVIAAKDNLTILANGDTIERSTASGTLAFRLLDVAAGASLTLQNLTLQGGLVEGTGSVPGEGAGTYNQGALTLSGVTVQDNIVQGARGGGWAFGGGIYSSGALTLEGGTLVQNNQVLGGAGTSTESGSDSVLSPGGNAYGGGICVEGGTATLSNVTLSSNTAQGGPGGSYASDYNGDGFYYISGGNGGSGFGGALAVLGGTVSLTSVNISSNSAQGGAGGDGSGPYSAFSYYGDGGAGGSAFGGGMYVAALVTGTVTNVTVTNVSATNNVAAGAAGTLGSGGAGGSALLTAGWGYGGGLYIAAHVTVDLDAFTQAHVSNNTAPTDPNIDGTFIET